MGTISLKIPDSLHKTASALAKQENISLNQLIILALAEKMSALMTEEYLGKRAKRGKRGKFIKALAKVADVKPNKAEYYRENAKGRKHEKEVGKTGYNN